MGVGVSHTDSTVVVRLGPLQSVFALKGRLDIPRSQISSIEVMERSEIPATEGTWLRAPGTYIPGLVRYGSYGREPLREFWLVLRQKRAVVITVAVWAYHRVVIGSNDPDRLASELDQT